MMPSPQPSDPPRALCLRGHGLLACTQRRPATAGGDKLDGDGGRTVIDSVSRLDETTGIGRATAQVILAAIGTDVSVVPAVGHLVPRARLTPRAIQSS